MGSTRKLDKKEKLQIYMRLLAVDDPDKLNTKAFAESLGIDGRSLGGMLTQLKNSPRIRLELRKLGYTSRQLPEWIAQAGEQELKLEQKQAELAEEQADAPKPDGKPVHMEEDFKQASQLSQLANQPTQLDNPTPPSGPMESPQGNIATPIGQSNREAWMRKENIYKSGDKYYKLVTLTDSSTAWKEVQVPSEILASESVTSGRVSEMIFDVVEAETQSLVRKVSLNPNVYTGYNFLKARGDLDEKEDLGDFINLAVDFFLDKGFGMRVAVITDENRSLIKRIQPVMASGPTVEYVRP